MDPYFDKPPPPAPRGPFITTWGAFWLAAGAVLFGCLMLAGTRPDFTLAVLAGLGRFLAANTDAVLVIFAATGFFLGMAALLFLVYTAIKQGEQSSPGGQP